MFIKFEVEFHLIKQYQLAVIIYIKLYKLILICILFIFESINTILLIQYFECFLKVFYSMKKYF